MLLTPHAAFSGPINLNFQSATPGVSPGTTVSYTFPGGSPTGLECVQSALQFCSAALDWNVHGNAGGDTIMTNLVIPAVQPPGTAAGSYALQVMTSGSLEGIWQAFSPPNTGPTQAVSSVYVYLNSGSGTVFLGTGNSGVTGPDVVSTSTTGSWQLLTAPNGNSPANELIVYANTKPANFLVSSGNFTPSVPEPGTLSLLAIGAAAIALRFKKQRNARA